MSFNVESYADTLDLFSTSPTLLRACAVFSLPHCAYGAPYFAVKKQGARYAVVQGCCNHWDCPKCGQQVARQHYGRIVEGCRTIAEHNDLWFITLTCRGADLTAEEATTNYLAWTSKFLDACYSKAKRAGKDWYYVQVTEKQKRGHPHSHILTTFTPDDIYQGFVEKWQRNNSGDLVCQNVEALRSQWVATQCERSGLGDQYDISKVKTVEGASRYVAKYMFKPSQFAAHYPKRWKRVRYSQSFPKLPEQKTDAFVLLSADDWRHLARLAAVVDAVTGEEFETAQYFLRGSDTIIHERQPKQEKNERPMLDNACI